MKKAYGGKLNSLQIQSFFNGRTARPKKKASEPAVIDTNINDYDCVGQVGGQYATKVYSPKAEPTLNYICDMQSWRWQSVFCVRQTSAWRAVDPDKFYHQENPPSPYAVPYDINQGVPDCKDTIPPSPVFTGVDLDLNVFIESDSDGEDFEDEPEKNEDEPNFNIEIFLFELNLLLWDIFHSPGEDVDIEPYFV